MSKLQLMIDLETLASASDAAVVSIGAVYFDHEKVYTDNGFYAAINMENAAKYGSISAATVRWWFEQGDDARLAIASGTERLPEALQRFSSFARNADGVWGFGATFDNVILRHAYTRTGIACPWHYRKDRCFRTLSALFPVEWPGRTGTHHNALDDAITQADVGKRILAQMQRMGKQL